MGLHQEELDKAKGLSDDELYSRIRTFYIQFSNEWNNKILQEKSNFIFGNGRTCRVEVVDACTDVMKQFPKKATIQKKKDLGKAVLMGNLEFAFHNLDEHGIKMGAYANGLYY